ncbi:MAG: hypothetical protein FJ030_14430 [Chloroflexi bacterium]|nr:hypothetical protein [Chloroflexota bacterium]
MLVAFNIILDDIVFPDGRTAMGVVGGGGPQAAFGMRLWADSVGLAANVGDELPQSAWAWLRESGIDTTGVRVIESSRTPRAWQVTEEDGRRTHVWRVRPASPISFDQLPESYRAAEGYHFGIHPGSPDLAAAAELRREGRVVSVEMFRASQRLLEPTELFAMLSSATIFSEGLREAQSLVGPGSARSVARRLVEAGESRAQLLTLRLGDEGSLVVEGQTGRAVRVPAVPVRVSNVVGAGNAYCGGFLAGWILWRDLARAGACGAVAASFVLERAGLPVVTDQLRAESQRRLDALTPLIEYTSL